MTPRLPATHVAPVCEHVVTAAGVAAAAMQLFRVVSQELTPPTTLPTAGGKTDWACMTAQDSSVFAQVARSLTTSAAWMHFTLLVTQVAVPVTIVGKCTWTTLATHWASVVAHAASWVGVVAELVHSRSELVHAAVSEIAELT